MAEIDYSSGSRVVTEGTHAVYAKAAWGDEWVAVPNLKCLECAWHAAPDFNTAILRWDIGAVIVPGDSTPTTFTPWVGRGHFIRVDWVCDDASILRWVGFADASQWPTEAFGSQQIVCYGLEHSLAKTPIFNACWRRVDPADDDLGIATYTDYPLTFNADDGLRSQEPVVAIDEEEDPPPAPIYAFAAPGEVGAVWSTREIVRYLMTYHLPTDAFGVAVIPWAVDQIDQLPDWDSPTIGMLGRTVWDILNELVNPRYQLGFTFGSDGTTAYLRCFTHLATDLTVTANTIDANPNQHTVVFAPDALTEAELSDVGGGYDQVIVRGARRQTICTLYVGTELAPAWSPATEVTYETGSAGDGSYSGWDEGEKIAANARVRSGSSLHDVYRTFKFADDWDYKIDDELIFPSNATPRTVTAEPRLPIHPDAEWDGTVDEAFLSKAIGRPMLVFFHNPTVSELTEEYVATHDLAPVSFDMGPLTTFDYAITGSTKSQRGSPRIAINVEGGPQHILAANQFDGLTEDAVDVSNIEAMFDYETAFVTVALSEDRYCERVYPSSSSGDVVRRLLVDAGESYRFVRIQADTVTGLDVSGELLKSDGGTLVDDSDQLETLAKLIALGRVLTRKTVAWRSRRKISTIAVGDLITTAAGQAIVAPVVGIHIRANVTIGTPAPATVQSFEVYRGEQDPIGMLRRVGALR
ncbi:hypothetical protein [Aureliella helgolandensis]|uniref:Uncharacterized protein n=1 Tax=Aureliella helgolandensis TaxID=2527968 RepID=A0A518G2U9_9BACT|nr:hypothetical protein [Aureliella helgolandensis]QDV22912.1 hypothetical protein Q31a_12050 [Aureliella helgolandensis]